MQVTLLGTVTSLLLGDFSTVLAGGVALVGQAHCSRTAEADADVAAVYVLRAAHIPPAAMVTLFDKMAERRAAQKAKAEDAGKTAGADTSDPPKTSGPQSEVADWLGIAFASHPPDEERVRFFEDAATGR